MHRTLVKERISSNMRLVLSTIRTKRYFVLYMRNSHIPSQLDDLRGMKVQRIPVVKKSCNEEQFLSF